MPAQTRIAHRPPHTLGAARSSAHTQIETATPVMVITAEDIAARGFTGVADALQKSTFATGSFQGSQTSASFTQRAETISMFGLSVGYTKFLIDGRPMVNYPALYN